jgi:hypothetical protein
MSVPNPSALLLTPGAPAERSSEFVPVTGGQETSSESGLLIAAYILMWACVFGLVWFSIKRVAGLDKRLVDLERQLKKHDEQSQNKV